MQNLRRPPPPFLSQDCGGTLIAPDWVLTAAWCVMEDVLRDEPMIPYPPERLRVLVGQQSLSASGGEIIPVRAVIPHPDFENRIDSYGPDIALLQLSRPATVEPIPYARPEDDPAANSSARLLGWGARQLDSEGSFDFPDELHQLDFTIVDQSDCVDQWADEGFTVQESQICAVATGSTGANDLDEGGPFFVQGSEGPVVVGIPFFIFEFGSNQLPTVFTRVSPFVDWIEEETSTRLHFAQAGTGGDSFSSDFLLQNTSESKTIQGTLSFFDPEGNPLVLDLLNGSAPQSDISVAQSEVEFELAPLESRTYSTNPAGELVLGSAVAEANGDISGVVRFEISGIGIAGVGASPPLSGAVIPARRVGSINTAVAVRNTSNQAVNLTARLLRKGAQVASGIAMITIAPGGRKAQFINEIFPDADTAVFVGSVTLETDSGPFAAVALELGQNAGEFTVLPARELKK